MLVSKRLRLLIISVFLMLVYFWSVANSVASISVTVLQRNTTYKYILELEMNYCILKPIFFLVVMYGCENWTIKKAEHWRIDAFELWCWKRLLRVPWTAKRSNQSILKKISPECSLEGLMLKLKLQYFGHLTRRADSFEKTLMLGKIEGRRRGWQRMRWVWASSGSWWWTGKPGVLQSMGFQRVEQDWATELNRTDLPRDRIRFCRLGAQSDKTVCPHPLV